MTDAAPIDLVLRNAIRQLAHEARRAAATVKDGSPAHDFYVGVETAAKRRLEPGLAAMDPPDLAHRSTAFRDGYLEAAALIGVAATREAPLHLPLPAFVGS